MPDIKIGLMRIPVRLQRPAVDELLGGDVALAISKQLACRLCWLFLTRVSSSGGWDGLDGLDGGVAVASAWSRDMACMQARWSAAICANAKRSSSSSTRGE